MLLFVLSILELLSGCCYGATSVPTSVPMGVSEEYDFCVQNVLCDSPLRAHCLGWKNGNDFDCRADSPSIVVLGLLRH